MRTLSMLASSSSLALLVGCVTTDFSGPEATGEVRQADVSVGVPADAQPIQLLWVETNVVIAGACAAGQLPVRASCTRGNSQTVDRVTSDVKQSIGSDETSASASRTTEVTRLKDADSAIVALRADVQRGENELATAQAAIVPSEAQVASKQSEIDALSRTISSYDTQLAEVDHRLQASPGDPDLVRLRGALDTERRAFVTTRIARESELATLTSSLATARTDIARKTAALDQKRTDVRLRYDTLSPTSPETDRIDQVLQNLGLQRTRLPRMFDILTATGVAYRSELLDTNDKALFRRVLNSVSPPVRFSSGFLEVQNNGEWRGVCDDGFNEQAARVACRMVGLGYVSVSGEVSGPASYWLDDVVCGGNEGSLFDCAHSPLGNNNCGTGEHVRVTCR